jgi:3-hydroxymyristoyl/3-hydroxydecanoyl-(acyl carrier protein) dehydratase
MSDAGRRDTARAIRDAAAAAAAAASTPPTCVALARVGPEHPAFAGHFPGRPVLPAVVILAEVLAEIEAQTRTPPRQWTVASAKFFATVAPDEPLTLSHATLPSGSLRFDVQSPRGVVATGVLAPRHAS